MLGRGERSDSVMEHETEPGRAESPDAGSADTRDERAAAVAGVAHGTGEPRVDAALRLLDRLPGLPVSEHPELFEQVHAQLTEVLGELDSPPAPQAS
jgi:hypothetical protein